MYNILYSIYYTSYIHFILHTCINTTKRIRALPTKGDVSSEKTTGPRNR